MCLCVLPMPRELVCVWVLSMLVLVPQCVTMVRGNCLKKNEWNVWHLSIYYLPSTESTIIILIVVLFTDWRYHCSLLSRCQWHLLCACERTHSAACIVYKTPLSPSLFCRGAFSSSSLPFSFVFVFRVVVRICRRFNYSMNGLIGQEHAQHTLLGIDLPLSFSLFFSVLIGIYQFQYQHPQSVELLCLCDACVKTKKTTTKCPMIDVLRKLWTTKISRSH